MKILSNISLETTFKSLNEKENYHSKQFLLDLEENEINDTHSQNYFELFNIVGAKATVKLNVNPKNLSENITLTPTLSQCYIETADFNSRLLNEIQPSATTKQLAVKVVLMKTGVYDFVKIKPTVKTMYGFFFLKKSIFKRKSRKYTFLSKINIKRRFFLQAAEMLKVAMYLEKKSKTFLDRGKIKSYIATVKTLKLCITK